MPPRTIIEFARQLLGGRVQPAGNRVQLEDANGVPYSVVNPIPMIAGLIGLTDVELRAAPVPTLDAGASWTSLWLFTDIAGGAVTHVTTAPVVGERIVITDVIVSSDTTLSVLFEDHSGNDLFRIYLFAGGTAQFTPRSKFKLAVANDVMTADPSFAGNVAITVFYYSEP